MDTKVKPIPDIIVRSRPTSEECNPALLLCLAKKRERVGYMQRDKTN
jgi:hypothetical protein